MSAQFDAEVYEIPPPGLWARWGACRAVPTPAFFAETGAEVEEAKRVCRGCAVLEQCRSYVDRHPQLQGVWGATSDRDRRKTRRLAAPPPAAPLSTAPLRSVLERLVAHPGRWAWVRNFPARTSAGSVAAQLRHGDRVVPPGRWEFEGRVNDAGGSDLYVRYLGAAEVAS